PRPRGTTAPSRGSGCGCCRPFGGRPRRGNFRAVQAKGGQKVKRKGPRRASATGIRPNLAEVGRQSAPEQPEVPLRRKPRTSRPARQQQGCRVSDSLLILSSAQVM